jgi:Protein of unknown function (DUF2752)
VDAGVVGAARTREAFFGRRVEVELASLRWPGAAVLAAGAALPLFGHPGPGCLVRAATGIPCPLCGMSTSVEDAVRLDFVDALNANPMGLVVTFAAVAAVVVRRGVTIRFSLAFVYVALFFMWVFQLARFEVV